MGGGLVGSHGFGLAALRTLARPHLRIIRRAFDEASLALSLRAQELAARSMRIQRFSGMHRAFQRLRRCAGVQHNIVDLRTFAARLPPRTAVGG